MINSIFLVFFLFYSLLNGESINNTAKKRVNTPNIIVNTHSCTFDGLQSNYKDFSVFAVGKKVMGEGIYETTTRLKFQIDQTGNNAQSLDITVNSPDMPVALIIGLNIPMIWNISWTEGTDIIAVYLSGNRNRQILNGLKENTPILRASRREQINRCKNIYVNESPDFSQLNSVSMKAFNKKIDKIFLGKGGKVFIGKPLKEKNIVSYNKKPVEYYANKPSELAGIPAIEKLVTQGVLRKATKEDIQNWVDKKSKERPDLDIRNPPVTLSYIALKHFTLPNGLNTSPVINIFIPKGIQRYEGGLGRRVTIFYFDTLKCKGLGCIAYLRKKK